MNKKLLAALVIIILIGSLIAINITRNRGDKVVTVKTTKVKQENIASTIFLDGKVDLDGKRDIRSHIVGTIKEVKVKTGDKVKVGQVIIYLDRTELDLQKQQAEIQLGLAKEKLNQIKSAPIIPGGNQTSSTKKGAELEVKSAQASLDKIKSQIAETVIKSPINGTVLFSGVQDGVTANPNSILMSIGNIKNLIIKAQVSEMDYLKIGKGQRVKITGESFSDQEYKGEVTDIAQIPTSSGGVDIPANASGIQSENATYQVLVRIIDPYTVLKPGFTTTLEIFTESKAKALVLPNEALVEKDDKTIVYRVNNGQVHIVEVKTGIAGDDKTEVLKGIKSGDEIIIDPDESILKENIKVKIND